ncbi:F-box protein At5g07610-like [Rhododendron vialii]|uniref:F-box protein At5g07610-like n=1 Tax=Rhododendron vialii TaxID=182163 RepID=UPI00265D84E0|nr:F-box protein At5g07610-like [Rhododendron vialii]
MSKKIILSDNKRKLSLTCAAAIIEINVDLLTEILLRVPAKSLIGFKSVSKQWLSLISDARFCRNHTRQNPSPPISGLYFYPKRPERDQSLPLNNRLNAVSVCDHPGTSLPSFSFMEDSGPGSALTVAHSSNGLMLCTFGISNYTVCNLTTQKFVVLPKLAVLNYKSLVWLRHYLIYDPKKSPYYRVVVVSNTYDHSGTSRFDVYSSESGSWKSTVATPGISNPVLGHGAVWNGAIFWMHCWPGPESCSEHDHFYFRFDIDAKRPTTTGVPSPGNHSKLIMYFGECGGHLLLIQIPRHNATEFRVLEMMDGENKFRWTVKYSVDLGPLKLPRSISYRFSVLGVMNVGANENDLAVVLDGGGKVIQYNIKGKTSRVLCFLGFGDDFLFSTSNPLRGSYHFIESLTLV